MNTNSTDFACLVTGFLTDYLPHHRCYSRNTILSYRDTLKLFLRFLKEEKETSPNSFYIKDFKRELVIEFLEWYRNNGAGITAANQRLAALKAFSDYAQLEHIEYIAPLQNVSGIRAKKAAPKEVSFLTVEQMSSLINSPDVNSHTGFRHRVILTLLYDSGCRSSGIMRYHDSRYIVRFCCNRKITRKRQQISYSRDSRRNSKTCRKLS